MVPRELLDRRRRLFRSLPATRHLDALPCIIGTRPDRRVAPDLRRLIEEDRLPGWVDFSDSSSGSAPAGHEEAAASLGLGAGVAGHPARLGVGRRSRGPC